MDDKTLTFSGPLNQASFKIVNDPSRPRYGDVHPVPDDNKLIEDLDRPRSDEKKDKE